MSKILKILRSKKGVLQLASSVFVIVLAVVGVRALASGSGVSEPVEISLTGSGGAAQSCFLVERISRRGGLVPLTAEHGVYSTRDWASGFAVSLMESGCVLDALAVRVGSDDWTLSGEDIVSRRGANESGAERYVIDSEVLGRTGSRIGYFGGLLNWPGDFNALARILRSAVVKAAGSALALLAILLAASRLLSGVKTRQDQESTELERENARKFVVCILATVIAVLSLGLFFAGHGSAFEWPAMDMAPFWMRFYDPGFAVNSFFADVSMLPSPRWVFGYFVVGLTSILGRDWYFSVFALRVLFTMSIPAMFFLSLNSLLKRKIRQEAMLMTATVTMFIMVCLSLWPQVSSAFALAMWPPMVLGAQPETLALLVSLLAMWIFLEKPGKVSWLALSFAFLFFATLVHPVRSLVVFVFFVAAEYDIRRWREYLAALIGGVVMPMIVLAYSFPVEYPLSAEQFVYHYIKQNHDFHYLPSNFGAVHGIPWFAALFLVAAPLIGGGVYGWVRKRRGLAITSAVFLASYCLSIVLEFLFVQLYPVKIFAIITPVRFGSMGFWMVAVIISWVTAVYVGETLSIRLPRVIAVNRERVCLGLLLGLLVLGVWSSVRYIDDPWSRFRQSEMNWTNWIGSETDSGDVFATNIMSVGNQLSMIHDRAAFIDNCFPFREDEFIEHDTRKDAIFGSYEEWEALDPAGRPPFWSWSKNQFRNLAPQDFVTLAGRYRLDYVIVEKGYTSAFSDVPVEYENDIFKVYKVENFR